MKAALGGLALVAGLVIAPAVPAQTTPESFLAEYQALYAEMGYVVEIGGQTKEGDTLVLTDFTFRFDTPDASAAMTSPRVEIRPIAEPPYEIAMVMSDRMDVTVTSKADAAMPVPEMGMVVELPGNITRVGGMPGDRIMRFSADAILVKLENWKPDPNDAAMMDMVFSFGAATADYTLKTSGTKLATFTGGAADMVMNVVAQGPDGNLDMRVTYTGLSFEGEVPVLNVSDPMAIFNAEETARMVFTAAASQSSVRFEEAMDSFAMDQKSGATRFSATFGGGQLEYGFEGRDTTLSIAGTALPMPPVDARFDVFGFRFAMPTMPREEVGELAFDLRLEGLGVSEALWGMFDPGAALPRDPATLVLRVKSAARALVAFMDPQAMESAPPMDGPPFQFEDLRIEELTLRIAGAEVRATGAATINNDGPAPMPVGGIDVSLSGVLGLAEKLQAIGLVPPQMAASLPAMLATFAVPGSTPDSFTSRVEMTAEGSITANGVPLQ